MKKFCKHRNRLIYVGLASLDNIHKIFKSMITTSALVQKFGGEREKIIFTPLIATIAPQRQVHARNQNIIVIEKHHNYFIYTKNVLN